MKAEEIVTQMIKVLPTVTDFFSDPLDVGSVSNVGPIVTVITDTDHGMETGRGITVSGSSQLFPVSVLSQSDGIASCTTSDDNDLTTGDPARPNIEIIGANESEYNGEHLLLNVFNRRNFKFQIDSGAPAIATGTIFLNDTFRSAFNGRFAVTVVGLRAFTYTVSGSPANDTIGQTISIKNSVRVAKSISIERAIESYTKQESNKMWAFVVLGDVTTSRDRAIIADASETLSKADKVRVREIELLEIYVFIPTGDEISGAVAKDLAKNEVKKALYSAIFLYKASSVQNDPVWSLLTPVNNTALSHNGAYYIHVYNWERAIDIVQSDGVIADTDKAFRDIDFSTTNEFGETIWSASVDLDDQPL